MEKAQSVNPQTRTKYLKIDLHTHILPKQWPDLTKKYGYGGWVSLDHFEEVSTFITLVFIRNGLVAPHIAYRPLTIGCNCWSPERRVKECEVTGVSMQVLSTVPVMFSYWAKPEHALDLSNLPGWEPFPMQAPELAVQELKRCVEELGLAGVQIGSHAAEALDCVVFVHPWDMDTSDRMSKFWFPWLIGMPCETTVAACSLIFGGVLERHPNLKLVLAHGGGSFLPTLGRIDHGFKFLNQIYVDSLVHDIEALRLLVSKVGADHVLLGSDYPFPLGEHHPGKLIEEADEFSEKDKRDMLSGNAARLLKLDPSKLTSNVN
ncbi:hypothetical protein L0F63_000823 [Massospora cicadina]|nr:hypothetical protein L0F63_000823 [Massospora cicadina]